MIVHVPADGSSLRITMVVSFTSIPPVIITMRFYSSIAATMCKSFALSKIHLLRELYHLNYKLCNILPIFGWHRIIFMDYTEYCLEKAQRDPIRALLWWCGFCQEDFYDPTANVSINVRIRL